VAGHGAGGDGGSDSDSEDDYYGLNINHVDHLDPQAFQPSHTLEFVLAPGATAQFFEDVRSACSSARAPTPLAHRVGPVLLFSPRFLSPRLARSPPRLWAA
jgi:hypothetical protein